MITRPRMSRNEWELTERGASEVERKSPAFRPRYDTLGRPLEKRGTQSAAMLARYDIDDGYYLHKDAYDDRASARAVRGTVMASRRLTALLYLTDGDWDAERDDGCLRVHSPRYANGARDIAPLFGRVVLFDARKVWHEVRPSPTKLRRAMTIWVDAEAPAAPPEPAPAPQPRGIPPPCSDKE